MSKLAKLSSSLNECVSCMQAGNQVQRLTVNPFMANMYTRVTHRADNVSMLVA